MKGYDRYDRRLRRQDGKAVHTTECRQRRAAAKVNCVFFPPLWLDKRFFAFLSSVFFVSQALPLKKKKRINLQHLLLNRLQPALRRLKKVKFPCVSCTHIQRQGKIMNFDLLSLLSLCMLLLLSLSQLLFSLQNDLLLWKAYGCACSVE